MSRHSIRSLSSATVSSLLVSPPTTGRLTPRVATTIAGQAANVRRRRRHVELGVATPGGSILRRMASSAAVLTDDSEAFPTSPSPHSTYTPSQSQRLSPLTALEASSYLSNLLALPPTRTFPPDLALRILTHKSYTGSHVLGSGFRSRTHPQSEDQNNNGGAAHNARLAFLGKRAFRAYFLMFLHRTALVSPRGMKGLGMGDVEERCDNLMHVLNLGREVGMRWGLGDVMRWTSNRNDADLQTSGSLKIQGEAVQAILGGTMMQFGSPAAHRLFHTAVLPYLIRQLRNDELNEAAEVVRKSMVDDLEGRIVV